jgi:hypothetical protein
MCSRALSTLLLTATLLSFRALTSAGTSTLVYALATAGALFDILLTASAAACRASDDPVSGGVYYVYVCESVCACRISEKRALKSL